MGLPSSPIKIRGKSVQGFLSYDRTNKQTDTIQRLQHYIDIDIAGVLHYMECFTQVYKVYIIENWSTWSTLLKYTRCIIYYRELEYMEYFNQVYKVYFIYYKELN